MTNEIEKQFFDTFGLEPKLVVTKDDWEKCKNLPRAEELFKHYPQITDHILLELICICNNTYINGYTNYFTSCGKTVEEIKKEILKKCIFLQDDIKQQVQALFKED